MTDHLDTLTIADTVALGSGSGFWATKSVGSAPSIVLTDGPHGVRSLVGSEDSLNIFNAQPATCFPPAVSLGQSWDPELLQRVGSALGREAQALGVHVLLGPGINIKRDPRCGRNFEYYSEDPFISGVLGAAWVNGVQGEGVGASVKHFAVNNQEFDRMEISADVDPRTLREIYLRAFQRVVTEAKPWTIMAAYNRINGVHAAQNRWLLTDVLRQEWGFDGVVVSDWGAVSDRVAAVAAGTDLEMPGTGGATDAEAVAAIQAGTLDRADAERAARRVSDLAQRATDAHRPGAEFDADAHHALAREAAGRSIALLKNDANTLPLEATAPVAVIGAFARAPRFQGGGSSQIVPTRLDTPWGRIQERAPLAVYAEGFTLDGSGDAQALRVEAVAAASASTAAVVLLGLPEAGDSEGADRTHIDLPEEQLELLAAVAAAQPRTIALVMHGGVVRLARVADLVPALLDTALLGQAGGAAIADVLFGDVNPSGKLTETVPERLEDTPSYLTFPGELGHVRYSEGIHVGYRWFDARDIPVTFPFGHGLSYTTFEYGDLTATVTDAGDVLARIPLTNTGARAGREIVQLYLSLPSSTVTRAPQHLVGFSSVELEAGETREVVIRVDRADIAYWNTTVDQWIVEDGDYVFTAAASSRDLRSRAEVHITGDAVRVPLTLNSYFSELLSDPAAVAVVAEAFAASFGDMAESGDGIDMTALMGSMPIGRLVSFSAGAVTREQLLQLIGAVNSAAPENAPIPS